MTETSSESDSGEKGLLARLLAIDAVKIAVSASSTAKVWPLRAVEPPVFRTCNAFQHYSKLQIEFNHSFSGPP